MNYLVTTNYEKYKADFYKIISVEESLELLNKCKVLQADSETTGLDPYINKLLCFQLGNDELDIRIIIDCTTINIKEYKELLESKILIFQNAKFDLQFLYTQGIVPRKVWDTMIVEQLLYLGYPKGSISYSLDSIAYRRLQVNISKDIREEIASRGLDNKVIEYAINDVVYLEKIASSQKEECIRKQCLKGAIVENNFVPCNAYLEWCGIKLDEEKWKAKMTSDKENLDKALKALNNFVINTPALSKYTYTPIHQDLFEETNFSPKCIINWSSSKQVVEVAKILGFNTKIKDKKTNKEKDSVLEKYLKNQKGINDKFIELYFNYQKYDKVVSSFGQGHLNAVHPITKRLHTNYNQLGTVTSRMSSGGGSNKEVALYKRLNPKEVPLPNMQQLPHDAVTRSCFVSEEGNLFCSCDYDGMEARLSAVIYDEKEFQKEFLYGSGDLHSVWAKYAFPEELKNVDTKDIKKLYPELRQKAKAYGFSISFGSDGTAIAENMGISVEESRATVAKILQGLKGFNNYKIKSAKEVEEKGYIIINKDTGHKQYWYKWDEWVRIKESFNKQFWEIYKREHKGKNTPIANMVTKHSKERSSYHRSALNSVTQGGSAIITKTASTNIFNWIIDNNYFNKIKIVNITHDEINTEFPKELEESFPVLVEKIMLEAGAKYYDIIPLTATYAVGNHWIH